MTTRRFPRLWRVEKIPTIPGCSVYAMAALVCLAVRFSQADIAVRG
jgi:hypothetical protein